MSAFFRQPPLPLVTLTLLTTLFCGPEVIAQIDGPVWATSQSRPPSPPPLFEQPAPTAPTSVNWAVPPTHQAPFRATPAASTAPPPAAIGRIATALAENRARQRQNPKDVQLQIQEARYLSWLSRHYTAANRFRSVLRRHPNHVDALTGYGSALYWQSDWRGSHEALARAVSLARPDDLAPRAAFFRVLAKQGQASEAYRQAVELDRRTGHRDAELGMVIADMLAAVGLRNQGLAFAERPTNDSDLRIRQTEYRARQTADVNGRRFIPQLALDLVNRTGRQYSSYNTAGDLLALYDFEREALDYYEQAIRIEPEREEARLGKARVLRTRGRHSDALQAFQSAAQHNPESVNGWLGVAEMSRFKSDYQRAWQALDTAQTIAPASAEVFRERLKLADQQNDRARFQAELARYRQAQPHDPWVDLIAARHAADNRRQVNESALRRLLDPMAPDVNAEAARLLRRVSGASIREVAGTLPAAPSPELNEAAGREVRRRLRTRIPGSVNLTVGYEHSSLKPTTPLGGNFPDWHEAYFAGFWRRQGGQTFTFDYRHFDRFGDNAQQLQGGLLQPLNDRWTVGGHFGGALFGSFIPHWRLGAEAGVQATERLGLRFEYRHLRFADEPVHQFIPEATWKWSPHFDSTARLYLTHSNPKTRPSDTGLTAYFDLAYRVASNSHVKIHYAHGDENASALIQALIGEKNFQSTGVELRLGINERCAIIPSYRFERHNLFDLHAVAIALNGRF